MDKKYIKTKFIVIIVLIGILSCLCVGIGTIKVPFHELVKGLIDGNNPQVEIIRMVRLPRIVVSMISGATLAVSGVLLQSVMKNPLADPGIVGISAGASFASALVTAFAPRLFFATPVF